MNWKAAAFLFSLVAVVALIAWITRHPGKQRDRAVELKKSYEQNLYEEYRQGFPLSAGKVTTVPADPRYPRVNVQARFPVSVTFIPEDLKTAALDRQGEDLLGKCTEHEIRVTVIACKLDPGQTWVFSIRDERKPDPDVLMPGGAAKSPANEIHLFYSRALQKRGS